MRLAYSEGFGFFVKELYQGKNYKSSFLVGLNENWTDYIAEKSGKIYYSIRILILDFCQESSYIKFN